jgi:hypothetical protein
MSLFSKDRNVHRFTVAGKPVTCPLCGGTAFVASSAQLHTQGLTFFQLEWLGKTAYVLVCDGCSQIQWFGKEPEKVSGA